MGPALPGARKSPGRWRRLLLAARAHPGWALLILAVGLFGAWLLADSLHTSDREQVLGVLSAVRDGVVGGDASAVLMHASPFFSEGGIDYQRLAAALTRVLGRKPIARAYIVPRQVEVRGPTASVRATVTSSQGGGAVRTEWLLTLEKTRGQWLIRRATPLTFNSREIPGLPAILWMGL